MLPDDFLLPKMINRLYDEKLYTDLEFIVYGTPDTDCVQDDVCEEASAGHQEDPVIFTAHRVVVSARCTWFKRALLSGMKESIDRYAMMRNHFLENKNSCFCM